MRIGLAGLPLSGKTTLFNVAAKAHAPTRDYLGQSDQINNGSAKVPDERIDFLSEIYNPKKTTFATIEFTDIPGISNEDQLSSAKTLADIRICDAIILVVRLFEGESVPHVRNKVDPVSDLEELLLEFVFSDLDMVNNKLERIAKEMKASKKPNLVKEQEIMTALKEALESEKLISEVNMTDEQEQLTRGYRFLTQKPLLVVGNCSEEQYKNPEMPIVQKFKKACQEKGFTSLLIPAQIETEIADLSGEEQSMFLAEYGIEKPASDLLIAEAYKLLNYISFLTYGHDEVRAWSIQNGTIAQKAAGKIHSDIEKGFIRAEIIPFEAFKEKGSVAAVKAAGLARLEGKEYIISDGDMVEFRFNV
ncbi:MAG: redox-regulated ATPase YchF [Candidatus Riflebacteria bacterium]|nr:redox-regulated ATPase YchF [Candidatus Riflebacteria bacterium]